MSNFVVLFDLIGELARRRYQAAERCFSALGLNHTEARLLTLLWQEGEAAAQDALSNRLFIDRTNAGRAMQRLEEGGYIVRTKQETDKRAKAVRMTEKGRKAVGEIAKRRVRMAESFFGELGEQEAGVVVDLLKKALPGEESAS